MFIDQNTLAACPKMYSATSGVYSRYIKFTALVCQISNFEFLTKTFLPSVLYVCTDSEIILQFSSDLLYQEELGYLSLYNGGL